MANTFAPFGFKPYRGTGSAYTAEHSVRKIAYNNTTVICRGDAVVPLSTGYIDRATSAAGVRIEGIFVGCKYLSTSMKRMVWSDYWPGTDVASTAPDIEAYVIDDPNQQFVVQSSDLTGSSPVAFANIGEYIDIGVVVDGNTATGRSKMFIEQDLLGTTVTLPFRIVGLIQDPPGANGTDITTEYNHVIVAFNNASTRTNGAGPTGIS